MRKALAGLCTLVCLLGACRAEEQGQTSNSLAAKPHKPSAPPMPPVEPRTSLPEPKGPIDPKSVEAAGQVVQYYGALIEQDRFAEAAKLWTSMEAAAAFATDLPRPVHLEIAELGEPEGAAGSIYVTMPAVFYGESFRRPADIILRRVNEVPGSTEEQRRWHIDRIEWAAPR